MKQEPENGIEKLAQETRIIVTSEAQGEIISAVTFVCHVGWLKSRRRQRAWLLSSDQCNFAIGCQCELLVLFRGFPFYWWFQRETNRNPPGYGSKLDHQLMDCRFWCSPFTRAIHFEVTPFLATTPHLFLVLTTLSQIESLRCRDAAVPTPGTELFDG